MYLSPKEYIYNVAIKNNQYKKSKITFVNIMKKHQSTDFSENISSIIKTIGIIDCNLRYNSYPRDITI